MTSKKSYSKLKAELDEIIKWFEGDEIDIDKAIDKYEEAIVIVKDIDKYLKEAENRLTDLKPKKNK